MISKLLESADLPIEQSQIYACLLENGALAAGKLAAATGLSRPSVYDHLKALEEKGLARTSTKPGVKTFIASSPEQIGTLLETRLKTLEKQKKQFDTALPALMKLGKAARQGHSAPQMRPFDGADGIRHALSDMIESRDLMTRSFLPIRAVTSMLSAEFFRHHNNACRERNLKVKAVWSLDNKAASDMAAHAGKNILRDIRVTTGDASVSGYWIYGTKTVFLSCGPHPFAFIIDCADHAQLMTQQHDVLWNHSQALALKSDALKPFLFNLGVAL